MESNLDEIGIVESLPSILVQEKLKLKSILQNFQNNKLTTNNLYKQEKKLSLNSFDRFIF